MTTFGCGSKPNMGNRTLMRLDFFADIFCGKQSTCPNHTKIIVSKAAVKSIPTVPPKREGVSTKGVSA